MDTPVTQIFLLVLIEGIRSPSNEKSELVQPQLFQATPHSSRQGGEGEEGGPGPP